MKQLLIPCIALAASIWFTACADEPRHNHDHGSSVSSTTTEQTTVHQPVSGTTDTQVIRTN